MKPSVTTPCGPRSGRCVRRRQGPEPCGSATTGSRRTWVEPWALEIVHAGRLRCGAGLFYADWVDAIGDGRPR